MLRRHLPILLILVLALLVAGCGEDKPDPLQDEVNSGARAALEAQGIPPDLADCLTDALEEEFPVDRLEELMGEAREDPFGAFGPDEQESILKISQSCGGPGALLGLPSGAGGGAVAPSPPPGGGDPRDEYFDCVANAGSSAEIKKCETPGG